MKKITAQTFTSSVLLLAILFGTILIITSAKQARATGNDSWGIVDCWCNDPKHSFSSVGESTRDHNVVGKGKNMTWFFIGPTGTTVTLTFKDQGNCQGSPFANPSPYSQTIQNKGRSFDKLVEHVRNDAEGCYYYEIDCSNQTAKSDPIIDVPR